MTRDEVRDLIAPILPGWTVHEPESTEVRSLRDHSPRARPAQDVVELRAPAGCELTMVTLDQVAEALGTRLIDVGSAGYWYGEHGVQLTVRWP